MKLVLQDQQYSTKTLKQRYILALCAVAVLAILGQILIQYALNQQSSDARTINYAGRQRYLSMKLTAGVASLMSGADTLDRQTRISDVRTTLDTLVNEHHGLIYGDSQLGLLGENSQAVLQLLNSVEGNFQMIHDAATRILERTDRDTASGLATPPSALALDVKTVLAQEAIFVPVMDKTVSQYQHEAEDRVSRLRLIEYVLCGLTLLVLLLEGRFVFHPALSRLQKSMNSVVEAEKQVAAQVKELEAKNNELELAFSEAMAAHRKVMPHARVVSLGHYQVQGSQGNYYNVESHQVNGTLVLECMCPMYNRNMICSHSLAAASLHSALLRQPRKFSSQPLPNISSSEEPKRWREG